MVRIEMTNSSCEVQRECRERVWRAAPRIMDALIEQAGKGSCQHAKFLFDFAFAAAAQLSEPEEEDLAGPSLAEILLERLDALMKEAPPDEAVLDA
jgi:hypothetical protein